MSGDAVRIDDHGQWHDSAGRFSSPPDPIGDIAAMIREHTSGTCDCTNARTCSNCRRTATLIWMSSPGHREATYHLVNNVVWKQLSDALVDLFWRATQYGQTDDGDVAFYLLTKGTVHRLIGAAQCAGIPAAFRAVRDAAEPEETP